MDKKKSSNPINYLSVIADIVTIGLPIVSYTSFRDLFPLIVCFAIVIVVIRIKNSQSKIKQIEKAYSQLKQDSEKEIATLNGQIDKYKEIIKRIEKDFREGRVSSELLINRFIKEVDKQYVSFETVDIGITVQYEQFKQFFDVSYCWNITGKNPSSEKTIQELSFIIAGDSIVRNNDVLHAQAFIHDRNGNWQPVNYYIRGVDSRKVLTIDFGIYAIRPLRTFKIKFTYIWPKCYVKEGGDVFSFGTNTFSSVDPYSITISIKSDKRCFNSADLQIREKRNGDTHDSYSELKVIESDGSHIVTTQLAPSADTDRAIYISLKE